MNINKKLMQTIKKIAIEVWKVTVYIFSVYWIIILLTKSKSEGIVLSKNDINLLLLFFILCLSGGIMHMKTKKIRKEFLRKEERYYRIFNQLNDVYYEASLDGRIITISPSIAQLLGYNPEKLIGRNIGELYVSPSQRSVVLEHILQKNEVNNEEVILKGADGTVHIIWLHGKLDKNIAGEIIITGTMRDVTDYIHYVKRTEESELNYKLLFEKMANGYFILEPVYNSKGRIEDVKIVDVNPAGISASDISRERVVGKTWFEIMGTKNSLVHKYERLIKYDENIEIEGYHLLKNRYFNFLAFKISDTRIGCIMDDITERRTAEKELEKINLELEQRVSDRTRELLEAIKELEKFTYIISHDLKAPLKAQGAYLRIISEDYPDMLQGDIGDKLEKVVNMNKNMITMINKLLSYTTSVDRMLHKEIFSLGGMIKDVFKEQASVYPHRDIRLNIVNEIPEIKADKVLFRTVLENIISNAIKFTRDREISFIEIGCKRKQGEIIISIKDNGVGFDSEYAWKLFNVFERLHSRDEFDGSGIGLATVRKIIELHQGRVAIEGTPNEGVTVYLYLPEKDVL